MKHRLWTALLAFSFAVTLSLPAAATGATIADFLISASSVQVKERTLELERYAPDPQTGRYVRESTLELPTQLNRVSPGAQFTFRAQSNRVTVYVDCLTDLDGDGQYEWLDGGANPAWTELSADGILSPPGQTPAWMVQGDTRTLSAVSLLALGMDAERARGQTGTTPLAGLTLKQSGDLIYCITAQCQPEDPGQAATSHAYYVQIDRSLDPDLPVFQIGAAAFSDTPSWAWYWNDVDYAGHAGLLSGTGWNTFSPDGKVNRATLVQVLYNREGKPAPGTSPFPDAQPGEWYAGAVSWASGLGLVSGFEDGTFRPYAELNREQLALILYQYARYQGADTDFWFDLNFYPDGSAVSPWAREAMVWAVGSGVFSGRGDKTLSPADPVTRAELAAVLTKLCTTALP